MDKDRKIIGGYYIKARKIRNSAVAHFPPYIREIWDYLLCEANHKDREYEGFTVKRGQLFRSYRKIRDDLSWQIGFRKMCYTKYHMKAAMKALRKARMIDTMKAPRGVLITVLNYDFYQNPKNYEAAHAKAHEASHERPDESSTSVPAINKNDKNKKKEKKKEGKKYSDNSHEIQLSMLLFSKIRERDPDFKKPVFNKWAEHIDKIIRLDNRTPDQIRSVIIWCQEDDFWQSNILSTSKLRKQFSQLWLKMKRASDNRYSDTTRHNIAVGQKWLEDMSDEDEKGTD